jgi:hypothetical protein
MICPGGGKARAAFGDDESISPDGACFGMSDQVKTLLEQILQSGPEFVAGERETVFRLGDDVVKAGFEPVGLVGDLAVVDAISQLEEECERYVGCGESAFAGRAPAASVRVGLRRSGPDGGDFKREVRCLCSCCTNPEEEKRAEQERIDGIR